MSKMRLSVTLALLLSPAGAMAQTDFRPALEAYYTTYLSDWGSDPLLIEAIRASNLQTTAYDQAVIDALDAEWMAEIGTADSPTISAVLDTPTSDLLRQQVASAEGRITEVFIMDARGLNVAASAMTSDLWQGDEAKFTETFDLGNGAVHYSEVELDESTGRYQAQISFTVTDPDTALPIGAITVAIDAETLN
jgi:hypothetical protein